MSKPSTYAIATWDGDADGWHAEARGLTLFGLRPWLRKMLAEGWDRPSLSVINEARWAWDTDIIVAPILERGTE